MLYKKNKPFGEDFYKPCELCKQLKQRNKLKYCRDCNIFYCSNCYEKRLYIIIYPSLLLCGECIVEKHDVTISTKMNPKLFNGYTRVKL